MSVKNPKPPDAARAVTRLKRQLEVLREQKTKRIDEFKAYQANCHEIMTSYVSQVRNATNRIATLNDTLANNNVTITELQQQVALQQRMTAEAQQDGGNAIAKYNRSVQAYNSLKEQLARAAMDLADAQQTIRYRLRVICDQWITRTRVETSALVTRTRNRIVNWWAIKRLNRARVNAMHEAGYIPEKLIKMAHVYWEADRLRTTEMVIEYDGYGNESEVRQTMWRRIRIWMGRS